MIELVGDFSVDVSDLKTAIKNFCSTKRPAYYNDSNERLKFLNEIDELHKKLLTTLNGLYVKIGPYDWNGCIDNICSTKFEINNYVYINNVKITKISDFTDGNNACNKISDPSLEFGNTYVFDSRDSEAIFMNYMNLGLYEIQKTSIPLRFLWLKAKVQIHEITEREYNEVKSQAFTTEAINNARGSRYDALRIAISMTKKSVDYKILEKELKIMKDRIKLIKLRQSLLFQRKLLENSQSGIGIENRDGIPEMIKISSTKIVDNLEIKVKEMLEDIGKKKHALRKLMNERNDSL